MIKCDTSMKRSKERCYLPDGRHWRCDMNCQDCHCALHKRENGTWEHFSVREKEKKKCIEK